MISAETLRGLIAKAADTSDGDDVATRRLLAAGLGTIVTMCPHAGEDASIARPTAEDGLGDTCALGGQLTPACEDCLLSR
jgi:hypothetical protein